jgi:hypothetical protein
LKEIEKGRKAKEEDVSSYWITLSKKNRILEFEVGSIKSYSLENSLRKRL